MVNSPSPVENPTLASFIELSGGDDAFLTMSKDFMSKLTCWDTNMVTAIQQTIERILIVVHADTATLSRRDATDALAIEAKEAGLTNLEDLLWGLCFDLEAFKTAMNEKIFLKHIQDCQQDESIREEDWYSIFPDARHPLSTTWPWSIKPSLAVIWGVCWMFYPTWQSDENSNYQANDPNQQQMPDNLYDLPLFTNMDDQQNQARENAALRMTHGLGQNQAATIRVAPPPRHDASAPDLHSSQAFRPGPHHTNGPRTPFAEQSLTNGTELQHFFGQSGSTPPSHHYTTDHAASTDSFFSGFPNLSTDINEYDYYQPNHQQAQQPNLPQLNHRAGQSRFFTNTTALNTSTTHPPPPGASTPIRSAPPFSQASNFSTFPPSIRSGLQPPNLMSPVIMQSPVSIARSREGSGPLSPGRKRALSDASLPAHSRPSPQPLIASTPDSRTDEYDLGNNATTPDRPEPRKNEHGQYICTFPGCTSEVFERKCEWTKHFDKHDRPYKCKDPACTKLQGFTYSGGLLRHQREVHGMHGGPKERLFCRFPGDCKRKSEKGFTRKENRDEHERRVHSGPFDGLLKEETTSPQAWSESSEVRRLSVPTGKRKASEASETDIEDLRGELKRLRQDNDELRQKVNILLANQKYQPPQPQRHPSPAPPEEQVGAWRPANSER
ncbi:hypothetical protein BDZ85DRAFT_301981 [Elsinoe ampelina]|uniref:C2H2-type domain-containing protein n=1 Tax=Elsinoe ampelina TaxID=302913 RepID=A0A6A6G5I0_9PEZI|nr:hypothetical protein BDZ85DRAFT_301981 [Elsinoe ampelina]